MATPAYSILSLRLIYETPSGMHTANKAATRLEGQAPETSFYQEFWKF